MLLLSAHLNEKAKSRRGRKKPTRPSKNVKRKRLRIRNKENRRKRSRRRSGRLRNAAENKRKMRSAIAKFSKTRHAFGRYGPRCRLRIRRILSRWSEPRKSKDNMVMDRHRLPRPRPLRRIHRHQD